MIKERFYAILGTPGKYWFGELQGYRQGEISSVSFEDYIEELYNDQDRLVGFYHTHPSNSNYPSETDYDTMQAWCAALGRDLVCGIGNSDESDIKWFYFVNKTENFELGKGFKIDNTAGGIMCHQTSLVRE